MKKEYLTIEHIPAILWGENSDTIYIFVHGKGGSKESARYLAGALNNKQIQVLSFDLPESGERKDLVRLDIFEGMKELDIIYQYVKERYDHINLCANSLGAYFALNTYSNYPIEKCIMYSPVVNMKYLVEQMMIWFNISLERLEQEKEIETPVDPLRYDYYQYITTHPIIWDHPTSILYGSLDNLQSLEVMEKFAKEHHCQLTIANECEHALMKEEEVEVLKKWLKENA